jgi:hypothetical protein
VCAWSSGVISSCPEARASLRAHLLVGLTKVHLCKSQDERVIAIGRLGDVVAKGCQCVAFGAVEDLIRRRDPVNVVRDCGRDAFGEGCEKGV